MPPVGLEDVQVGAARYHPRRPRVGELVTHSRDRSSLIKRAQPWGLRNAGRQPPAPRFVQNSAGREKNDSNAIPSAPTRSLR